MHVAYYTYISYQPLLVAADELDKPLTCAWPQALHIIGIFETKETKQCGGTKKKKKKKEKRQHFLPPPAAAAG